MAVNQLMLSGIIEIGKLNPELQFQIRVQISLRSNALNIMKHYSKKEAFEKYIRDREEKIKLLLGTDEISKITLNGHAIYP